MARGYDAEADAVGSYNDAVRAVGERVKAGEAVPAFFQSQSLVERTEIPTLATLADASASLKQIAVAEAGERHWTRAKDASQLFKAIKTKLEQQAGYAVWRQDVTEHGGDRKSKLQTSNLDLPAADPGAVIVHRWRKRLCDKEGKRWVVAEGKLQQMLDEAHHRCVRICEGEKDGTVRGTEGTGEFERYTPAEYVEPVRQVLGTIDLDPASSALAQQTVGATKYFTEEDDGLSQEWFGRVFLNPPYHRELVPAFIDKLIVEIGAARTTEAVVLTNNSTDTIWFQRAARLCQCICFTSGRIHFTVPSGPPVFPTQGQSYFYFGPKLDRFIEIFAPSQWRRLTGQLPVEGETHDIGFCLRPD